MIMGIDVDERLRSIFDQAWSILAENADELLRFNDTNDLQEEMYTISSVVVNSRSKRKRGCCKHITSDCVKVELSEYMLALPEKEAVTTMIHELLHCFRDSRGHTGQWLWRANYLKKVTGLNIQRVRTIDNEWELRQEYDKEHGTNLGKTSSRIVVYHITCECEKCGYSISRSRETNFTRHPERYFHPGCGGHFKRVS